MIFMRVWERGFTTAEIIVVIGIIALLATAAYGGVNSVRKKAHDTERRTELKQLEVALRVYKDSYGRYPATGCGGQVGVWVSPGPGTATWYVSCDDYISGLTPSIMNTLPIDPNETRVDGGYMYRTNAAGTEYKVIAHGTVESGVINKGEEMARCPASCSQTFCSQSSYAVYSPGASCW